MTEGRKRNKKNVSSCWPLETGCLSNAQGQSGKSFVAILLYSRPQDYLIVFSLSNVGKARGEYIEERVTCVQVLEYANFYSLELVTWFELATFNWDKALGKKNPSHMQMIPSVILLNIR